ncbi:nrfA [Symbiodinium microadriaticum]|nr:nrfA [Symbiodinium microadriaticum]
MAGRATNDKPSRGVAKATLLTVAVAAMFGVFGGLGFFTFGYGEGYAYLGNDPASCANCHVMQEFYDSWLKSSHHNVAVCNDCHTPHDSIVAKYLTKADNGFFHSLAFTTGDFKDPIQIKARNSRVVQHACLDCHKNLVNHLLPTEDGGDMISCVHCHASGTESMPSTIRTYSRSGRKGGVGLLLLAFLVAAIGTALVAWVLVTMFGHKQEARTPYVRVVELNEVSVDPEPWGLNWPHQFDGWKSTAGDKFYGGSSAMPESKLDKQPWLKRLYAGYAFSIDYREARGHAYMLYDQGVTERVTKKPQAGACLHCHGSTTVLYRQVGLEAMGEDADDEALAAHFNMEAVQRGFEEVSTKTYGEVLDMLKATPDGTPEENEPVFPPAPAGGFTGEIAGQPLPEGHANTGGGEAHPVTCIDCHDPATMAIRVTRPGFVNGIAALAEGDAPVPHIPSIEKWRRGGKATPYDPNKDASRQELRSFVCGQCHVEYYCASKMTLTFPWKNGLKMEDEEQTWEETTFPDGSPFMDYAHGETGAPTFKVQHPEFELWSQGVHARNGVSCADCHMPYQRVGAAKVSNHHVRSPLENLNSACQTCHRQSEAELAQRIETIQTTNQALLERAAGAMTAMLDAILEAKASGAEEEALEEVLKLQRKATWRLDYVSSENSRGFHAPQEAARILAESIDYSRQAEALALRLRAPEAPDIEGVPIEPIQGVTPTEPIVKEPAGKPETDAVSLNAPPTTDG